MKNKKWISIIIAAMLLGSTGCQKQTGNADLGEGFIVGQDDQPNYLSGIDKIAMTKDGNFIAEYGKLEYFNWESEEITPVCSQSDCDHTDKETCNAYVCTQADEIMYYGDYLYYDNSVVESDGAETVSLYRQKKDGSNSEKLYDLYALSGEETEQISTSVGYAIHRGSIYYNEYDYDTEKQEIVERLCCRKLEKDAEKEVLQEYRGGTSYNYLIRGYGNGIYYMTGSKDADSDQFVSVLYRYDIVSGKTAKMASFSQENSNTFGGYTVIDGNLYYKNADEIIKKDKETGEETVVYTMPADENASGAWLYGDFTYLYLNLTGGDNQTLLVLDTNGEKVDEIVYGDSESSGTFYGADENYLFFNLSKEDSNVTVCYDKKQLGTGTFETKELLKMDNATREVTECK